MFVTDSGISMLVSLLQFQKCFLSDACNIVNLPVFFYFAWDDDNFSTDLSSQLLPLVSRLMLISRQLSSGERRSSRNHLREIESDSVYVIGKFSGIFGFDIQINIDAVLLAKGKGPFPFRCCLQTIFVVQLMIFFVLFF
jgi:hypothetical protein